MAVIYCRADGDDSDGLTWAKAKQTLQGALTAAGAGGRVYVSDDFAETPSTITYTSPGTAAAPTEVLCVVDAGDPEPPTTLATSATVIGTDSTVDITFLGYAYYYGVTFEAGTSYGSIKLGGIDFWHRMEQCGFKPKGSAYGILFVAGYEVSGALVEFIDCTATFNSVGSIIKMSGGRVLWRGGAVAGTAPTTLFKGYGQYACDVLVEGVDLSLLGSGKNLIDISTADPSHVKLVDCKLGASVTIATGTSVLYSGMEIEVVNCDSADTNYRYQKNTYSGDITQDAAVYRSGGASDGTTPISRKMVSSAACKYHAPLVLVDLVVWNESTGSGLTATVEIVNDGTTFENDEMWIEVEYLGTSGNPLGLFVTSRIADILTSPGAYTGSSETWEGTGGFGAAVKQYITSPSFTPQEKGPIRVRVMLAAASKTVYVCPKVTIA